MPNRGCGEHWEAIECVLRKLFKYPYANHITSVQGMSEDEIVDTFWDEFKMFHNKSKVYDKPSHWNSLTATMCKSHLWHDKYSRDDSKVIGVVACLSCSANPGIGPCERDSCGVKGIKFGNPTLMGANSIKKRSIVYTMALVLELEAREKRDANERIDAAGASAMFCDNDDKLVEIVFLLFCDPLTNTLTSSITVLICSWRICELIIRL
jgi:hypothetical protein